MVLAFTEEQKKEIEAKRMMVIEFKYNLRKAGKIIKEAWCRMKEIVDKAVKVRSIFAEKFLEALDDIKLTFEQIRETYHYSTSCRYRIAKVLSKCTGTDIHFGWKITRNIKILIARSCC